MTIWPEGHPLDDLALYAIDALDATEQLDVEAHLARCPRCGTELAAHRETLAHFVADEDPPDRCWRRITQHIAATSNGHGHQGARPGARHQGAKHLGAGHPPHLRALPGPGSLRSHRRLIGGLAAAAAIVLVVGLATGVPWSDTNRDDVSELANAAVADPDAVVATLAAADGHTAARVVSLDGRAFALLDDLSTLPDGRTYQLWKIDGGEAVSLGLLGDGSDDAVALGEPPAMTQFAISAEAAGGAAAPTGPVVASGATRTTPGTSAS